MTDELHPDSSTATHPHQDAGAEEKTEGKLRQEVHIDDLGACRKRIRVSVDRADIDARFGDHFKKLTAEGNVPGFRPGKAPRRLVEKRFQREVTEQVKSEVLMASLQQLGEDHNIAPLSEPNLNLEAIELPHEGPLVYEFEVEVRPEFDLPPYRGLKLRRPVRTFTEADVTDYRRLLLTRFGQVVPKPEGNAQIGDVLVADLTFQYQGKELTRSSEVQLRVEKDLVLKDGMSRGFADKVSGAGPGDNREIQLEVSSAAANPKMVGQILDVVLHVKEVKKTILPELTPEFLEEHFGVQTPGALDELILVILNRQQEHSQRRSARMQVLEQISSSANWDLPRELLQRQAQQAINRRIMEMKADNVSDEQILQQRRRLEQDVLASTAMILKEHFVFQKIAEVEAIDVDQDDVDDEIERMAQQSGESARRVRARLEREGMLDSLAAEMIERKVLDLILESAQYEDVIEDQPDEESTPLASVEVQAIPGELRDPTAAPSESPAEGEAADQAPAAAAEGHPETSH